MDNEKLALSDFSNNYQLLQQEKMKEYLDKFLGVVVGDRSVRVETDNSVSFDASVYLAILLVIAGFFAVKKF